MGRETSAFWALLGVGRGNAQQSDMSTVSSQQETFEEEAFPKRGGGRLPGGTWEDEVRVMLCTLQDYLRVLLLGFW